MAIFYIRKSIEEKEQLEAVQRDSNFFKLRYLRAQLNPHFLFNTLNAISALIHQDVELADRMIARLGDLLRTTLDNANQQHVPFQQELDFIQPYLEIEKARLGPRLTVDLDIDPGVMAAQVPNLILQPHQGSAARETREAMGLQMVENLRAHFEGRPLPSEVK